MFDEDGSGGATRDLYTVAGVFCRGIFVSLADEGDEEFLDGGDELKTSQLFDLG